MEKIEKYYSCLINNGEKLAPMPLAGILAGKLQRQGIKYTIKLSPGRKDLFIIRLL